MAQSRTDRKAVVGRLDPFTHRRFKIFCAEYGLTTEQAVDIAIKWMMLDNRTIPPIEGEITHGT